MQSMYLGDAAVCYKKVDPAEALKLWQTSGDLLVDAGKFARAAKTFQVGQGVGYTRINAHFSSILMLRIRNELKCISGFRVGRCLNSVQSYLIYQKMLSYGFCHLMHQSACV